MKFLKKEIALSISNYPIWSYLAQQDIKSRFRRSKLGIVWIIIHQLSFSVGAGLIWATVFNLSPRDFVPFLALGFVLWGFIAAAMVEGCASFVLAHGYLKQLPLPQSIFILRTLSAQLLVFCIGLLTVMAIVILFGKFTIAGFFYCMPGILLLTCYAYGVVGTMAYLGLRYRDLQHGLSGILSLLFVVTPVIYPPAILLKKGLHFIAYGNPFSSLIEIIREPLLSGQFAAFPHYLVAGTFASILIVIRFLLAKKWGRYVPFWS